MAHIQNTQVPDLIKAAQQAKRAGDLAAAERLFLAAVNLTEDESQAHADVAPACYEGLAILYSQRHDYHAEILILERFARQRHAPGVQPSKLLARLEKVRRKHGPPPLLQNTSPRIGSPRHAAAPQAVRHQRLPWLFSLKGILGGCVALCMVFSCIAGQLGTHTPSQNTSAASENIGDLHAATGTTRTPIPASTRPRPSTPAPTAPPQATATRRPMPPDTPTQTMLPVVADGHVTTVANLRSQPQVNTTTLIGRFCPGDGIQHQETRVVGAEIWYHIQVVEIAPCAEAQHVRVGSEGWVNAGVMRGMDSYAAKVASLLPTATAQPARGVPQQPAAPAPESGSRVGAICRDGSRSGATGRGACSHHGGVARWLYAP